MLATKQNNVSMNQAGSEPKSQAKRLASKVSPLKLRNVFESFDISFVLLRGFATSEGSKVSTLAVLLMLGVQAVTFRSELANHSLTALCWRTRFALRWRSLISCFKRFS